MPNLRDKTWTTTTPANVEDAQFWENHLISDEDSTKLRNMEGVPSGGTAGQVLTRTTSTSAPIAWADPASSGHTIQDANGNVMPYQEILQFEGADVSNDATNGKTVVDCHGQKGDAATIQVGTVTTLPPGSPATVTNSGTSSAAVFDFGIPSGADGGSTIKVTTTETALKGKTITLTGSTTLTATFDSNGVATFTGVTMTGTLTLYTSDGTSSATKAISVPYFGNYEESISFWAAIINVTATGINGVTVYAKKNGVTAASATVTNGSASLTVNSTGTYTIELTVNPGADDEYTYSESVTVSAESTYSVSLPIFITTLAISTTSSELYSQTITVTKGGSIVGTTAFSAQGAATFRVHETGTYTLTCTYQSEPYQESITIVSGDDGQTKPISIETIPEGSSVTPTDDIQTWLECAGIRDKTSYTTLSDVLADHDTLYRLMASDNAVDYLVRSTTWVSGITADEYAMKYIGKWNYASDELLDDSTWCTAICNSTYFESVLNTKVPIMTSNNTPSGVCASSSNYDANTMAWKAFDNDDSTRWGSNGLTNQWISYEFTVPVRVNRVDIGVFRGDEIRVKNFKIEAYDGNDYVTLYTGVAESSSASYLKTVDFPNTTKYSKYRLYIIDEYATGARYIGIYSLQFYGRTDVTENLIDIYSAANDTVYRMVDGSPVTVCTTDGTGHGVANKSNLPNGTYLLYSTVNSTNKSVTVTDGTSEIDLTS
jgi:hypothetical protein